MPTNLADIKEVLVDVDLLTKYRMFDRALALLETAIGVSPKSIELRERACSIAMEQGWRQKALSIFCPFRACISRLENWSRQLGTAQRQTSQSTTVHHLTAQCSQKHSASTTTGQPASPPASLAASSYYAARGRVLLSGDLSYFSLFDIIQVIENSRITGFISIHSPGVVGKLYFNDGLIADASTDMLRGIPALKKFAELTCGYFEVEKSPVEYKQNIQTTSNTSLILDILRELDEERAGGGNVIEISLDDASGAGDHIH